ncbi:MAG: hypothetical protein LRZ85_00310 [Alphaproteobacteria bacterium]|nr:hypothetical protein [Alphaproteobacteria bacterium]MCD8571194.1 hypothetical protein [Alphaproteobacteria bacterium]
MNILYMTAGANAPAPHIPANQYQQQEFCPEHGSLHMVSEAMSSDEPDMVFLQSALSPEDEQDVIEWIMSEYPNAGIVVFPPEE